MLTTDSDESLLPAFCRLKLEELVCEHNEEAADEDSFMLDGSDCVRGVRELRCFGSITLLETTTVVATNAPVADFVTDSSTFSTQLFGNELEA